MNVIVSTAGRKRLYLDRTQFDILHAAMKEDRDAELKKLASRPDFLDYSEVHFQQAAQAMWRDAGLTYVGMLRMYLVNADFSCWLERADQWACIKKATAA